MLDSRRRRALFITILLTGIAGQARAQGDPQRTATAMALYDQAAEAMEKGDYAAACPKLEEAVRLDPAAIGARMTLAQCYEKAGRLALIGGGIAIGAGSVFVPIAGAGADGDGTAAVAFDKQPCTGFGGFGVTR